MSKNIKSNDDNNMEEKRQDSSNQDICKDILHDRGKTRKNIITLSTWNETNGKSKFSNHKRPVEVTCSGAMLKASGHCAKVIDQKLTIKDQKEVNELIVKDTSKDNPQSNLICLNILDSEVGNFSNVSPTNLKNVKINPNRPSHPSSRSIFNSHADIFPHINGSRFVNLFTQFKQFPGQFSFAA